ncbi:MAG: DUF2969 domain-containing protein [Tetragenococcus halophilus]|uniref:DUF2969 domain-containing protein n=1 Tax=Tetragenococcus halophilus TaxID=51669 RepID=UPI00157F82D9|nr:DUF2969 domain-containing protein [Tetragenococcus halophilus]MCF1675074.1 DUF2969 domain-containing protein [Tetragenococcus halophilus]MDN6186967.1 DUF2969 domain-containing protein [Tetragenococcus halophilus]MDN6266032.1 DUF2969 domain-containing protein [Tetragenococcus halophilus]MDN6504472.1 DUF2969 domain-containing protein [Tetragenococcus halophilus]
MNFEVRSLKKNKEIEVHSEETSRNIKGQTYPVTELYIGKKQIGEVLHFGSKEFQSFADDEDLGTSKTLDLAIETIIRRWNLHEN